MPLSFSQLETYRRCPRQYEYASVKKIPRQMSAGESFGSSVHLALAEWGRRERPEVRADQLAMFEDAHKASEADLSLDALLALWHSTFIVEGYATRVEADFGRQRGEALVKHFYAWWSREPRAVVAIEKGFSLDLDGLVVTGRFDRVEEVGEGVRVVDYKTSALRTQDEVDADLQLSIYAMAAVELFGKPCTELILLFLGEDGVTERTTARSAGQLADARKQIHAVHGRITDKEFHPTPSVRVCGSCPYRGICDAAAVRDPLVSAHGKSHTSR